ncbi:MAG TPA: hypothetical protein ENK18_12700 [Deltaproteobacteria bacterium]|nr:hypothetical protein [Deltaproteobacteria bacterium]
MIALGIGWLQWPRPPALDGERWFKVMIATLLRGHVDDQGDDPEQAAAWEAAVLRFVPYHPAGRLPERKISNPVAAALPGRALPGEVALIEALAALQGVSERWAHLYDRDEVGIEARLQDPEELGAAYDPSTTLGPGAGWEDLADWGAQRGTFAAAVARTVPARWILVEGQGELPEAPSLIEALHAELSSTAERISSGLGAAGLSERLTALVGEGSRLVLVGEEAGVTQILRILAQHAEIRDHVLAVVSVGGIIAGIPDRDGPLGEVACRDWLGAWFTQRALDTDVVRLTPYFSLQWLDRRAWPPGIEGLPLANARFPEPDDRDATATTLEVVDLGPLPLDPQLPTQIVARALIAVVSAWIVHRR